MIRLTSPRRCQRISLSKKGYHLVKMHKNHLVNWNALRPRRPSLFRSAGKGSKRGRSARHFGSGKMEPRTNPFGEPSQTRRFTSSQTHGKVRFFPCRVRQGKKTPHEPRSEQSAVLPWPSVSAQRSRLRNRSETTLFCALFLLTDFIDKLTAANAYCCICGGFLPDPK